MSHVPSYTITKPATTQAGKLGRGGCAPLVPSFPPSSPSPPRVRLAHPPSCLRRARGLPLPPRPFPRRCLSGVAAVRRPVQCLRGRVHTGECKPLDTQRCHLGCILLKIPPSSLQGATQFIPESHHSGRDPPLEMQMAEVTPGEGFFQDVYQVTAPAGAAFICAPIVLTSACRVSFADGVAAQTTRVCGIGRARS